MQLEMARNIAIECARQLSPFCSKINIAGSIRRTPKERKWTEVKDIEIVCLPNYHTLQAPDLFGGSKVIKVIDKGFITAIEGFGRVMKGGERYMKVRVKNKIDLDLFMPQPDDYYRQLVIRTGSAEYIRYTIAARWVKMGWCGTEHGLRRITDCQDAGRNDWQVVNPSGEKPPVWASEEDFYNWLGLPMIAARLRKI